MDKDKHLKEIKNDQLVNEGAGAHSFNFLNYNKGLKVLFLIVIMIIN